MMNKKNQKEILNILDGFNSVEEGVCLLSNNPGAIGLIVDINKKFCELIKKNKEEIIHKNISNYLKLIEGYQVYDNLYDEGHKIVEINRDKNSQFQCISINLKSKNEKYVLLKLNPNNLDAIYDYKQDWIYIERLLENKNMNEGYIFSIWLYGNNNSLFTISSAIDSIYKLAYPIELKARDSIRIIRTNFALYGYYNGSLDEFEKYSTDLVEKLNNLELFADGSNNLKYKMFAASFEKQYKKSKIYFKILLDADNLSLYNDLFFCDRNYRRREELNGDITEAIIGNQFILYAQPIFDIIDKKISGLEILLRWKHPEYGLIMPNDFIPDAEILGNIIDIDYWVFKEVVKQDELMREQGVVLSWHVNVSTQTLNDEKFYELLAGYASRMIVDNIDIEITERDNSDLLSVNMNRFKELGYRFAIDDFGTGYSSFVRILNSGVAEVKIDKCFIDDINVNANPMIVIKTIINMAENLGISVVAEGVETDVQIKYLLRNKCRNIQGYYFDKPMALEEFIETFEDKNIKYNEILENIQ